jgi:hypothetical protein
MKKHTPAIIGWISRAHIFILIRTITPKVYFFPCPDDSVPYTFVYYAIRRIEDAGAYTNTADVNFRFLPCLVAGLAYFLSLKVAPDRIPLLKQIYEENFKLIGDADRDRASYYAVPERTMYP